MNLLAWIDSFLPAERPVEPRLVSVPCEETPEPAEPVSEPPTGFLSMPAVDLDDLYPARDTHAAHHGRCCWCCGFPGVGFCPDFPCRWSPEARVRAAAETGVAA